MNAVGQPSADWDIEIIDNAQFAADYVEEVAKTWAVKADMLFMSVV